VSTVKVFWMVHTANKDQITAPMIKSRSMSMAIIRRVFQEASFAIAVSMKKSHPIICFWDVRPAWLTTFLLKVSKVLKFASKRHLPLHASFIKAMVNAQ
jgi:hypothetical protein